MSKTIIGIAIALTLTSCGETKRISRGNYLIQYRDNQAMRLGNPNVTDTIKVYQVTKSFRSKVDDKTDYLIIKSGVVPQTYKVITSISVAPPISAKVAMSNAIYTTDSYAPLSNYQRTFCYRDFKFALQTLTIPMKFRKALDDGTKFPAQVETGVNIGFAPVMKYNFNSYNPLKKIMGKSLNTYSINGGGIINLGATDLKVSSNSPGLKSDRKAPLVSYGTFLMLGVNNINFGFAWGKDSILGEGRDNWVYQNKGWRGVIIALDIIKP